MAVLIVNRTEQITLEQSHIGQEYARRAIKKFREMPGTVLFAEDTQHITVTHKGTYGLEVEDVYSD